MTFKTVRQLLTSAKLLSEREALCRENGYRQAHLDLLDVLAEIKTPVTGLELEKLFRQKMAVRELTNFSPHESDFIGH